MINDVPPPAPSVPLLSTAERTYWIAQLLVFVLVCIVGEYVAGLGSVVNGVTSWAINMLAATPGILIDVGYVLTGSMTLLFFFNNLIWFFAYAVDTNLVDYIAENMSSLDWIMIGISLAASIALAILSGSAYLNARLVVYAVLGMNILYHYGQDRDDPDGIVG